MFVDAAFGEVNEGYFIRCEHGAMASLVIGANGPCLYLMIEHVINSRGGPPYTLSDGDPHSRLPNCILTNPGLCCAKLVLADVPEGYE